MTDFYDEIADRYDDITDAPARSAAAAAFVKEFLSRYPAASALDVACGTGMYAIPLAQAGLTVVGSDLSRAMLDGARRNAAAANVTIDWIAAPMQALSDKVTRRFDAVLCMGNSIPHLLDEGDLDAALAGFARMLNPGGIVVLQLLNYARVLEKADRIVGIDRRGDHQYVRFYDFLPGLLRFNILEIDYADGQPRHQLHSTTLRPYTADALRQALARHGFSTIESFTGLNFAPFDPAAASTVTLVGHKPR